MKLRDTTLLCLLALLPVTTHALDYTVNGWKIAVSVAPDSPSVMLGEPTWLSFKIENLSDENLHLIVGGDYRNEYGRPNSFKVRVTDEKGGAVPQPQVRAEFGGMIGPQPLLAKSNYTFRLFVPDWATFEKPGLCSFECSRTLLLTKSPKTTYPWTNTAGIEVSARCDLTLTPPDDARLGKLIERLGAELLAAKDPSLTSARKSLEHIHDDRVLAIWLQSQEQKTYGAKFHALNALRKYSHRQAVAALQRALDLTGDDLPGCCTTTQVAESLAKNIRAVAAHALAENAHPEARQSLLARRNAPDDEVRLTVVHMLGREKTDESSKILSEMTADTSSVVRAEAGRYLKERGVTKPSL